MFAAIDVETANPDLASICQIGIATVRRREGNAEGPLYGEVLAFTGALSMPRSAAADLAAAAGCSVCPGVTKETTLLVVGTQDIARLAGHEKSAKHRKAEALIEAGHPIRIIAEADFMRLCGIEGA